ncbi:hypothetical protein FNYG_06094 [Fusarium nygamai]|uniref:Uncharacterized protein n=1 Tax=Gibberella nygamai TaxID=42673 RepID=A0A2K0WDZ3_GIBNY|nr:hypothetical protein FNYG_06094 [Fusarium nygamai]
MPIVSHDKPRSDKWDGLGSTSLADGKEIVEKNSQYGFGQPPVLEEQLKRLGGVPVRMDPLHDTFQAVDLRLPAIRPSGA